MQLEKIISISGKPGLFKLVFQLRNGFIIEDVTTKKKANISNSRQVSLLDNISIFTSEKEVPLFEVFETIAKNYNYEQAISHKSNSEELKAFMLSTLPNYDAERVYESDIKKLIQWYNLLQKADYITPESFVNPEDIPAEKMKEEAIETEKTEIKPKKTAKTEPKEKAEKKPVAKTTKKATPKSGK